MIQPEELVEIGHFKKTHGIKGEIVFSFTNDSFDESECPFLFCEIDGVFVPFLLEEYRINTATTAFIQLKNIDTVEKAKRLINKEVYFPKKHLQEAVPEDSFTWEGFVGFRLFGKQEDEIGRITDIDFSTINTLFIVQRNNDEILIPAADELITRINWEEKKLYLDLPEGLLNLS